MYSSENTTHHLSCQASATHVRGFVMAREVQLAPLPRSRSYGCSSAPSLLFKLQQPLLPLGFLLCVRGSREAAMQPYLPCYQPNSSWCKKHNLATWKVWGCSAHGLPSQMVWHRARGRWFAGSTNLQQPLGISWIQPITLKTSNVVVRDSSSSSSDTAQQ